MENLCQHISCFAPFKTHCLSTLTYCLDITITLVAVSEHANRILYYTLWYYWDNGMNMTINLASTFLHPWNHLLVIHLLSWHDQQLWLLCRVKLATASACVFDIVVGLKTLFKTMMDNFSAIDAASWQLLILHIEKKLPGVKIHHLKVLHTGIRNLGNY